MAYAKTNWKDRIVENPRTYDLTNNVDGSIILTPKPGEIIEEGTPISASRMNKIEEKLHDVDKGLEPQVTTGTAEAYIADIPESTAIITIIPHIDNVGNTTLNGKPIYDSGGLLINSSDLKKDIPVQLIVRPDRFFVASSGSSRGPELLKTQPSAFRFLPNVPANAGYSCAACVGNYLYVFGGGIGNNVKELRRMDLETLQWEPPTAIPYYCYRSSCVVYEDKIYLVGGTTQPGLSVYNLSRGIVMYDPATGIYTTKAQNPNNVDMQYNSAVLIDHYIYVFSGMKCTRYNIDDDTWTTLADPTHTISSNPTLHFENRMYLFSTGGSSTNYIRYDIDTNTYTAVIANLPGIVVGGGGISMGTVGYILGGASSPNNRVYKFDFLKEEVTRAGDLSYPSAYSAFATDGTWFYVIGSNITGYEYMAGKFRPLMDKWYLPGGVSISPVGTFCISDGGGYVRDLSDRALKITKPGHFLLAQDTILTIKKGSSVLYANTLKSTLRLTRLDDFPLKTSASTSTLVGNEWYLFGLIDLANTATRWFRACKYNIKTHEVTILADTPNAVYGSCALYDGNGHIHLFGASGASYVNMHLIYDIATNTYMVGTSMPMSTYGICGGAKPPILHLYTGSGATVYYRYNVEEDVYTQVKSAIPESNSTSGGNRTAIYEDSLLIVGYGGSYMLCKVALATGFAQTYTLRGSTGSPSSCGCVCEGAAYYLGGHNTPRDIYARPLWIEENTTISTLGIFNIRLLDAVCCSSGSRIYTAGGEDLSGTAPCGYVHEVIPNPEQMFVNGKTFYAGVLLDGYGLQDVDQYRDQL